MRGGATFLPWRSDACSDRRGATDVAVDDLRGVSAPFVRIVAEHHTGFDEHPALKHARGFLIDSAITVTGAALFQA